MALYQQVNGKIHVLTATDLLGHKPGDYILYDAERRVYDLYRVEAAGKLGKSLSRFSITEDRTRMTGKCYSYDAETHDFEEVSDTHTTKNPSKALSRQLQKSFFNEAQENIFSILLPAELFSKEIVEAINQHEHPEQIAKGLKILKEFDMLNQQTVRSVCNHKAPELLADCFAKLKNDPELKKDEIFEGLSKVQNPHDLLEELGLVKDLEARKAILKHNDPFSLIKALKSRIVEGGFTIVRTFPFTLSPYPENFWRDPHVALLFQHSNPQSLALGLKVLEDADMLNMNTINNLREHKNLQSLALGLKVLHDAKMLNRGAFNNLCKHQDPQSLALGLKVFKDANMLDEDAIKELCKHQNPESLAKGLLALRQYNNGAYLNNRFYSKHSASLFAHANPESLAKALIILDKKDIIDMRGCTDIRWLADPLSFAEQLEKGDLYLILKAVTDLEEFIKDEKVRHPGSEKKADQLFWYTIEQIKSVSAQDNTPKALKDQIGQKVFDKAKKLWGTEHPTARVILDALLILLSVAGVGLLLIGAKKVATGHCFFRIGKGSEQKLMKELGKSLHGAPTRKHSSGRF